MSLKFALDVAPGSWAAAQARGDASATKAAIDRTIEIARIADQAGIESIWALEDPDGWDAIAVLTAMARVTDRIRLGTGVTNPYYRHPSLIAASISTLDLLSDGRAFLGLGRGQSEWYEHALGIKVGKPVRAIEETFDLLDQWWSPEMRASSAEGATEYRVNCLGASNSTAAVASPDLPCGSRPIGAENGRSPHRWRAFQRPGVAHIHGQGYCGGP